jgi:hypothetical protein
MDQAASHKLLAEIQIPEKVIRSKDIMNLF